MHENPKDNDTGCCMLLQSKCSNLLTCDIKGCKTKVYALNLEALNIPNGCKDQHRAVSSFPTSTKS